MILNENLKNLLNKRGYVKDWGTSSYIVSKRREFGAHLTSIDIFKKFIFPEIKNLIYEYAWIDLFCGEGNLVLPILEAVPKEKRIEFFQEHIFLYDIQKEMVEKSIENAKKYGIPYEIAKKNIQIQDTLQNYPNLKFLKYPPYHITNPPYLYLGYIVKHSKRSLKYFKGENEGYQDLYQIAMMNDLRHGIEKLIYIIPTNFLFGFSVSNKIRKDFLPFYNIKKAIIFEKKIFEFTGTNVCICFFERKKQVSYESIVFKALKINNEIIEKEYNLTPKNFYRAGGEFEEYVSYFKSSSPLKIKFYLTLEEVQRNKGKIPVKLLDVNNFSNGYYKCDTYFVNEKLYKKIKKNPLFVRTLDTGKWEGRVGIYHVREIFGVDGIIVTKEKYRTHPIQIFVIPELPEEDLILLKNYFNLMLEYFRDITDSEFLTTFKYSHSQYVRKYLGLSQTKKLLETFPIHLMSKNIKEVIKILIEQKNVEKIKEILLDLNKNFKNQITLFK
jgi:type I restriction-modification system DNA methylase subunit